MNLNQVTIPSRDVERAIQFYQKLGLKLIVSALPRYARFVCPDGESTFSIHKADEISTDGGVWIYFECNDLDEKVGQLIEKGLKFDALPEDKPWLWREAVLFDLDGHRIILYYAGENRLNPPWRLAEESSN